MRRCWLQIRLVLFGLVLLHTVPLSQADAAASAGPPVLAARSAALIDSQSGQILYTLHGDTQQFPASTTKLLTALLAAESGQLAEVVAAPADVTAGPDGTSCYLQPGEQQRLGDLLSCLMVASGNDAAQTIATALAGDVQSFVEQMNRRAAELGARDSHFANPHGLHDPMHYTTALDLARIGRAALNHPEVRRAAGLVEFTLQGPEPAPRLFYNHNLLLQQYPGMIAGKTGFTDEAQYTLVALAGRNGRELVGVLLGAPSREALFADMASLLDWGFSAFAPQAVVQAGDVVGVVPVTGGASPEVVAVAAGDYDAWLPVGAGWGPPIQREAILLANVEAPVASAQPLGEIVVRQGETVLGRIPVHAQTEVQAKPAGAVGYLAKSAPLYTGVGLAGGWLLLRTLRRQQRRRWDRRRGTLRSFASRRHTGRF